MTKKGIIYETLGPTTSMRVVESKTPGEFLLSGVFGVCGVRNNNSRIYEKANYGKMVGLMQQRMQSEAVLGELEHPHTMNITLENVSHKIEEITMNEDGTVTGTIRLLDTPKGKIAKAIIEGGAPLYISSRGAGSIDESGNVTLTSLQTYDLVGTPGFSQAKLTLKQGQKFESLNESLENPCWMIVEAEEETEDKTATADDTTKDDDKKNGGDDAAASKPSADTNITMEELKKSIDNLTEKVQQLESELHIAKEAKEAAEAAIEEANQSSPNYNAIQQWIEEEFAPEFRRNITESVKDDIFEYINEEYSEHVQGWLLEHLCPQIEKWTVNEFGAKINEWMTEEVAPTIQQWITEEYSGTLQNWITEEFAGAINNWIAEEYSGALQNWVTEEFTPTVQNWITEEYSKDIYKNVSDFLESKQAEDKFASIDKVLEKLSKATTDNAIAETLLAEKQNDKYAGIPVVEGMPANYRPLWEGLPDEKKDAIIRESRMYDMTRPGAVDKFWATRQLTAETVVESRKQTNMVVESVSPVMESRKNIFAQMKRMQG